ncbi:MAG: hypothetical protein CME66_02465 [Halobacteriovoraceae bacterium]|nr:hypothetical protein [Halobacteriovoraceae bacterium]
MKVSSQFWRKNLFDSSFLDEIEGFPSEGTGELYIGPDNQMEKLLLMQRTNVSPCFLTMKYFKQNTLPLKSPAKSYKRRHYRLSF